MSFSIGSVGHVTSMEMDNRSMGTHLVVFSEGLNINEVMDPNVGCIHVISRVYYPVGVQYTSKMQI